MPDFITPALYTALFIAGILRLSYFKTAGISAYWIVAAFLVRVIAGFANYYIWLHMIGHGDSLRYIHDSRIVYETLWQHPGWYMELLTRTSLQNVPEHLLPYQHSLYIEWHVPEYNMVRLYALLNIFSFGSAWGNIVLLSALSVISLTALFHLLQKLYTHADHHWLFGILFFLPSMVFWSSGLLKEGPSLILITLVLIQLLHLERSVSVKRIVYIVLSLGMLFLVRDYWIYLLIPNLLLWVIVRNKPQHAFAVFAVATSALLVICLLLDQLNVVHLGSLQSNQQSYFLLGSPDPDYAFHLVGHRLAALFTELPYALNNILFRPNPVHSQSAFRIYQSLELSLSWLFLIWAGWRFRHTLQPAERLIVFFCLELLLVYGLLVMDADTLSRYRSVPLFFLMVMAALRIPDKKKVNSSNNL